MLVDLSKAACPPDIEYDLAVIGSGPAGMTIVNRLAGKNVSVCLIEAGGRDLELRTQRLNPAGDNVWAIVCTTSLASCRFRLSGGSSNRWGGWLRPLDEIDYERRDWLPGSGWPVSYDSVARYHAEAAQVLNVPSADFLLAQWANGTPAHLTPSGDFEHAIFQMGPQTNFAENSPANACLLRQT